LVHIRATVAVHEAAALATVRVEVNEQLQVGLFIYNGPLYGSDRGLFLLGRGLVLAVQVDSVSVSAPLTTSHAIRVEHRHHFEDEIVQQSTRLGRLEISEFVKDSLEHVLRGSLATMDPTGEENDRLVLLYGLFGAES